MQRTVESTLIKYADTNINEDGQLVANIVEYEIPEKDEKKALKLLVKFLGYGVKALASKAKKTLYYMPDEIFFKYAVKIPEGMTVVEFKKTPEFTAVCASLYGDSYIDSEDD